MKLKKLFAGVVAVAMMATMAMPSFAAQTVKAKQTVKLDDDKVVNITVNYQGSGFGTDEIKLKLDETDNGKAYAITHSSLTGDDLAAAKNKTISVNPTATTVTEVAGSATTGTLTVTLPDYTNVGRYFYKLSQVAGSTAGMVYDVRPLYLMVNVINKDTNLSQAGFDYTVALFENDPSAAADEQLENMKIDGLTNVYTKGTFSVEKKVHGNMGDRNQTFNFRVTFTKAAGLNMNGNVTVKLPGAEMADVELTWTAGANNTEVAYKDFELTHGQKAEFANIPAGVTVMAYEMNGSTLLDDGATIGDYTVKYDDNTRSLTVSKETASGATVIENTSTVNVDTGVILDNAPYMLMLAVVAGGAMTLVIKKRREEE